MTTPTRALFRAVKRTVAPLYKNENPIKRYPVTERMRPFNYGTMGKRLFSTGTGFVVYTSAALAWPLPVMWAGRKESGCAAENLESGLQ
ncbi:uncharacterized protein K452DRAFT_301129 [Aplosporella prunicola CBS 121167]|uniref:Uncharacterized protein n=1 Tax=Aplosporella prunicola CBS 121167 TaxID=1176127 RepID=A0A6A6B5Q0_9PEZI|nr:uncharacterized protein K452DRAFT_301129 [Aplosporella prunicola CBS 121167]KAF2138605.1 hypothetical protein K452DRAFT_301129 [Aplosporella prunicola CBS 121167]